MSSNLPALPSPGAVSREMGDLPVGQRSEARRQALGYAPEVLEEMKRLSLESERDAQRVAAGKVVLAVAALLSSTNVPRDVVKEKFELTVDLVRDLMPPDLWAEFARRVRPIWEDV